MNTINPDFEFVMGIHSMMDRKEVQKRFDEFHMMDQKEVARRIKERDPKYK